MRKWLNPLIWVNGVDPLVLMKLSTEVNLKVLFQNDPCKNIVFGKTQTKLERITKDHSWALMRYAWIAALGLIPVCCVSAKICIQQFIELASNFLRPLKIADSIAVVAALAVSIGSLSGFMRPASLFCRRSLGGLLELIHARRLPIVLWGVYPRSHIENIWVGNQRTLQVENMGYPICISHHSIQNKAERASNSLARQPFPIWMIAVAKWLAPRISIRKDTKSLAKLSAGMSKLSVAELYIET